MSGVVVCTQTTVQLFRPLSVRAYVPYLTGVRFTYLPKECEGEREQRGRGHMEALRLHLLDEPASLADDETFAAVVAAVIAVRRDALGGGVEASALDEAEGEASYVELELSGDLSGDRAHTASPQQPAAQRPPLVSS